MPRNRGRIGWLATAALLALGVSFAPHAAQAQVYSEELRVKGFWPDLALSFGAGTALGEGSLATAVLGRARIGALYAYEPMIINLGITGELGALARRGLGVELELNDFGGLWLQLGMARVRGEQWMSHATLGFSVLGLEWQSRFGANVRPDDALLVVLRVPLGIWSFLVVDDARRSSRKPVSKPAAPTP